MGARLFAAPVLVALLATALLVPFANLGTAEWVHDDNPAIVLNPLANPPIDLPGILHAPYFGPAPKWRFQTAFRPVVTLGFALEAQVSGRDPTVSRVVSLLWHALAAALLGVAVMWLGSTRAGRAPTWRDAGGGSLAAAILVLHPAIAEAWVLPAYRPEPQAFALGLGATLLAARGVLAQGRAAWVWIGAAIGVYALALGSKETAVVWPAIGLAAAWILGVERARWPRIGGVVGIALAMVGALFAWRAHVFGAALAGAVPFADNPLVDAGVSARFLTGLELTLRALLLLFSPTELRPDYTFDAFHVSTEWGWSVLIPVGVLAGFAWIVATGVRRDSTGVVAVCLVGALAFWLPVSNLIVPSTVIFADRLLYGVVAFAAAAAMGVSACVKRQPEMMPRERLWWIGVTALVALIFAWASFSYPSEFKNDSTFYALGAKRAPRSARMRFDHGRMLALEGNLDAATRELEAARGILPSDPETSLLLGQIRHRSGDLDGATDALKNADRLAEGRRPDVLDELARVALTARKAGVALDAASRLVALRPARRDARLLRLSALVATGAAEADTERTALARRATGPDGDLEVVEAVARGSEAAGRPELAIEAFARAVVARPETRGLDKAAAAVVERARARAEAERLAAEAAFARHFAAQAAPAAAPTR